jgi:hypothetical protein
MALNLWESCVNEYAIRNGNAPFCALLTEEDFLAMEYLADINNYYKYGYAYPVAYEASCNLFSEVFSAIL